MTWDTFECPICGNDEIVLPSGPSKADVLIIGEFPGRDEIFKGKPLVGPTGRIMRSELAYLGMDMHQMRITNLWQHRPNKNEKCFEHGCSEAIKEAKGRKAILLVGSDTVKYFCDKGVTSVCGLQVKSPYLSAPIIYATVNPASLFKRGGVGEVRLALKKFVNALEKK